MYATVLPFNLVQVIISVDSKAPAFSEKSKITLNSISVLASLTRLGARFLSHQHWLHANSLAPALALRLGDPPMPPVPADPCLHNPLPAPLPPFLITPINPRYLNVLVLIPNSLPSGIPDLYGHFIFFISQITLKNIQTNRFP